ncbi:MAG: hypothetical protein R2686_06245 [Candidatus Nanopelagicales bacterium]
MTKCWQVERDRQSAKEPVDAQTPNAAWTVMNNLIAGILLYGRVGFLISYFLGNVRSDWLSGRYSASWPARI